MSGAAQLGRMIRFAKLGAVHAELQEACGATYSLVDRRPTTSSRGPK